MSGNRILFAIVVAILVLLVIAMLILATGSSQGPELVTALVRTLALISVVVLSVRLLRGISGRR